MFAQVLIEVKKKLDATAKKIYHGGMRSDSIKLRISPEERKQIEQAAAAASLPVAGWVRRALGLPLLQAGGAQPGAGRPRKTAEPAIDSRVLPGPKPKCDTLLGIPVRIVHGEPEPEIVLGPHRGRKPEDRP